MAKAIKATRMARLASRLEAWLMALCAVTTASLCVCVMLI